ncbi:MAG: protein-L-isoaspartate O-methyltransferase [Brevundimonas sp.]
MDFVAARKMMVDSQVRVNDVTDRALQAALLAVPRERFCAPDRAFSAYAEVECEIAGGRVLMLPREVAKLLSALEVRPGEKALAIAAPYAGAVLARLGAKVTAQEADQAVLDVVAPALREAGVQTTVAPFTRPHGEGYDIIISEGAVALRPQAWLEALAVVERTGAAGRGVLYVRGRDGFSRRELFDAAPPLLAGMTPEPAFSF